MRILIILNIIISLLYLISDANGMVPKKLTDGEIVLIHRRTYHVSIQFRDWHICNGVIISDRHILTAASCVSADQNIFFGNLEILSGTNILRSGGRIYKVANTIVHEQYNPHDFWINDIAILKLESPIEMNKSFQVAKLPHQRNTNHKLHVVAFGADSSTNNLIEILRQTEVKTMMNDVCKLEYYYQENFHSMQYCALPVYPTAHINEGDGGSPLMAGNYVIGIISLISENINNPAIYTRVYHYLDWIENIISDN